MSAPSWDGDGRRDGGEATPAPLPSSRVRLEAALLDADRAAPVPTAGPDGRPDGGPSAGIPVFHVPVR